jgi:hypothetical protein
MTTSRHKPSFMDGNCAVSQKTKTSPGGGPSASVGYSSKLNITLSSHSTYLTSFMDDNCAVSQKTNPSQINLPGGGPSASVGYSSKLEVSRWFWIFGVIGGWMVRLRRPSQLKPSNHLKQMNKILVSSGVWEMARLLISCGLQKFFVNGGEGVIEALRYETV